MTNQPKIPYGKPLSPSKRSTAVGGHRGPKCTEKAALNQPCATTGSQAAQPSTAGHRWVAVLLTLALSGALVACSSSSHSANVAATQSTSEPATLQSPSASATPQPTSAPATSASSSPALATNIEDLQEAADSEPYDTEGVAQVNGVSYPDSHGAQFCFGSNERQWTYVLGRKYSSLEGTIGLSDNSVSTAKIRFEVLTDGRLVYSKDLQVGQSAVLNVPVTNVLQLELDTILLTQTGGCGAATGEWADMQVVGPSASATPQPTSAPATSASSSPALATNIEDLQEAADSEPYDTEGVAQVNGVSYPDSHGAQFCFGSNERQWTYVLGRKYSSLEGTIGLSDNSVSTAKIRFEVLTDGRLVYSKDLQVGQSAVLNVPVTNVLQLELDTILLTQTGGCGAATGEWADMQVVGP